MTDLRWDEAKSIRLIREYKARPALWDPTHEFYYKKSLKLELWKEIGHVMNTPTAACRRKMLVLMSSLRREKARIRNGKRSGGKSYKSRWFAFEEMRFLLQKRQNFGQIDEDYQQDDDSSNEQKNASLTLHENKNTMNLIEETLQSDTPHQIPHIEVNDLINISRVATKAKTNSEAEIRAFADFVAAKMMKYSEKIKNSVEHSICDIIFNADIKSYNERNDGMQKAEMVLINEPYGQTVKLETEVEESD